jgi:mono/diheme cytochrome c family protein
MRAGGPSLPTPGKHRITLAAVSLLATAALYAQFNAGHYDSADRRGVIRQMLPAVSSPGATYDAGAYPLFPASFPAGAGRQEMEAYCNTCHSPRYITMQPPLPPQTWADEVHKMAQAYGASIPEDATQRIIQYLQANFSTGNRSP